MGERRLVEIEVDDLLRPLDRRVAEDDGVDETEDGRVGPDAEGERQDGDRRECRPSGKRLDTVAHVAAEVGGAEALRVATQLLDHLHASQAHERRAARVSRSHAPAHALLDVQRQVRLQLGFQFLLEAVAPEQIQQANPEGPQAARDDSRRGPTGEAGHHASPTSRNASSMATDTRFQFRASESACRRPAGVNA